MGSMASDIGAYLASQGLGTEKVDIFEGALPSSPINCIAVFERGGRPPVLASAKTVVAERPTLSVSVRNLDYETGYALAQRVRKALQFFSGTLGGTRYLVILARGSVSSLGMEETKAQVFQVSFTAAKEPVA